MERSLWKLLAPLPIMASAILVNSCIYDKPPGDEFYRTLWKSSDAPLEPLHVDAITLEFLCNGDVCILLDESHIIYGSYSPDGSTTELNDLKAYLKSDSRANLGLYIKEGGNITVTFLEAQRNGDLLSLLWQIEGIPETFTTTLHRLSDYE